MIEGNIIKFGYGTAILHGDSFTRVLTIKYMKPPKEVGTQLLPETYEEMELIEKLTFQYSKDMKDLLRDLDSINETNNKIDFRGYTFDFSNYNPKSVEVLKEHLKSVIRGFILALAC